MPPRFLALCVLAGLLIVGGCGGSGGDPVAPVADAPPDGPVEQGRDTPATEATCDDHVSWREAQDALDSDSSLEEALDDDYDGVACNELGQTEYEMAWPGGYAEACESVFVESPDEVLYLDGTGYEKWECEGTDSGAGEWEADAYSEPETDGKRDAWTAACDQFFNGYVGGELFWGDSVVVSQLDCDLANAY